MLFFRTIKKSRSIKSAMKKSLYYGNDETGKLTKREVSELLHDIDYSIVTLQKNNKFKNCYILKYKGVCAVRFDINDDIEDICNIPCGICGEGSINFNENSLLVIQSDDYSADNLTNGDSVVRNGKVLKRIESKKSFIKFIKKIKK